MTLSHDDAKDLERYYYLAGRAQRSIQGPMLERAAMMAAHCKPVGEITARPTAEVRDEPRTEFDEELIETIGRVSRKLRMISARHQHVLEALHGDAGACCAERMKKYGRLVSIFQFTEAGREIVRREKEVAKAGGSRLRIKVGEIVQNAVSRSEVGAAGVAHMTDALVRQAHDQALELQHKAETAYTDAGRKLEELRPAMPRRNPVRAVR